MGIVLRYTIPRTPMLHFTTFIAHKTYACSNDKALWLKKLYSTYSYGSLILHDLQKVKLSWVSVSPAYYAHMRIVHMSIE